MPITKEPKAGAGFGAGFHKSRKPMKYKMLTSAGTTGKISKRWRSWIPGQIIEAPTFEFEHLESKHYEILSDGAGIETAGGAPEMETADTTPADATAAAISLAAEFGIDLATVEGTGAGGKITKGDVENAIDAATDIG